MITHQGELISLVNDKNDNGVTPVYAAAIQGQDEVTEILLDNGAEADNVSCLFFKSRSKTDSMNDMKL